MHTHSASGDPLCIIGGAITAWRCSPSRHTGARNCAFVSAMLHSAPALMRGLDAFSVHPYAERVEGLARAYVNALTQTHTERYTRAHGLGHTQEYIYIYIYIYREREIEIKG